MKPVKFHCFSAVSWISLYSLTRLHCQTKSKTKFGGLLCGKIHNISNITSKEATKMWNPYFSSRSNAVCNSHRYNTYLYLIEAHTHHTKDNNPAIQNFGEKKTQICIIHYQTTSPVGHTPGMIWWPFSLSSLCLKTYL